MELKTKMGKGNGNKKADSLGQGYGDALSVMRTLLHNVCFQYYLLWCEGRRNHYQVTWGDVKIRFVDFFLTIRSKYQQKSVRNE